MNNGIFVQDTYAKRVDGNLPRFIGGLTNPVPLPYHYSTGNWKLNTRNFILVIDTTKETDTVMTLAFPYAPIDISIDWGDGFIDVLKTSGSITHRYNSHGTYIIQISGSCSSFWTNGINNRNKIIEVLSFGSTGFLQYGFRNCNNLLRVPDIIPVMTNVEGMFDGCLSLSSGGKNWNINLITSRSLFQLFLSARSFNDDISKWDTSQITNMSTMFFDCFYFNQNLNNWNVSKVTNFSSMFSHSHNTFYSFDGDLSNWQLVASGVNCANMFAPGGTNRGQLFTGKGLDTWNTSGVVNMNNMLTGNNLFNQNLSSWDTSKVTNMAGLFNGCSSFAGSGLNLWNTTSVTGSLASTFNGCSNLNVDLGGWNTSNVTNMNSMFASASSFIGSGLSNWNVSKVTDFSNMFASNYNVYHNFDGDLSNWQLIASGVNCSNMFAGFSTFDPSRAFTGKGLDTWNTSGVTNMSNMFYKNTLFNTNIGSWNTSNVTNMSTMFSSASSFNQPLNNWNVRKVTNFASMFQGATSFNSSLSGWALGADTAGTSCASMFLDAKEFNQDLGSWDTSKVTNMNQMFANNTSSVFNNGGSPSISGWNTGNVTNMSYMFANNRVFNQPIGSWDVSKVQTMSNVFQNTNAFDQDISNWNLAGLNINTALDGFMFGKTGAISYSTANYDALLIGWNNNKLVGANGVANWRTDLRPNFGGAKYTAGGAAAAARAALVSYGWTITDGGTA